MTRGTRTGIALLVLAAFAGTYIVTYRAGVKHGIAACIPVVTDSTGWAEAHAPVAVAGAPAGSSPILHVSGHVPPKSTLRLGQKGTRTAAVPPEAPSNPPSPPSGTDAALPPRAVAGSIPQAAAVCISETWPTSSNLGCSADADVVKMGDAVLARLRCGATIVDPEGRTVGSLPLQPAGEITALAATSTIAPKWHLDLLGGITTTGSAEAGIAWTGRGRIGAYALAEHAMAKRDETDPTWRAHLGFRWRIR